MRRVVLPCSLALIGVLASAGTAGAAEFVAGELIVRFKPGVSGAERADARREHGATVERALAVPATQLLHLPPGQGVRRAVAGFEDDPRVEYAEPNYRVRARAWPTNDPLGPHLWGMHAEETDADIDAAEGWARLGVSPAVTVAVVDSGVDLDHPDLQSQLDVVAGSDLVDGDDLPDDEAGHGTHVAGTLGALGNDGVGVTGVSHDVRLLPIRVLAADGSGTTAAVADGFAKAAQEGASIVNASLGGSGPFPTTVRNAILQSPGVLFVVAAGNGDDDGTPLNNDAHADWPCNYDPPEGAVDNVVCVAASDTNDAPASWSNFGPVNVDIAAPGVDILSTVPGGYTYSSGTSMSTPHVAGAAALVLAQSQNAGTPLGVAALKALLLSTGDASACWAGLTVTGARLNVGRALGADESGLGSGPTATSCPVSVGQQQALEDGDEEPAPAQDEPAPPSTPAPPPPAPQPAPPPATDSATPTPLDITPPMISASTASRYRTASLLHRGLRARIGCDEACGLRADVLVGRRTARRLGISGRRFGRSYILVGRARSTLSEAGSRTVVTRITRRAHRGLRRARSVRLVLRVLASDQRGNNRVTRRSVTVRR